MNIFESQTLFSTLSYKQVLENLLKGLSDRRNVISNPRNASNAPFYQQKAIRVLWKHKVISSPFSDTLNILRMQKQHTSCSSRGSLLIIFIFFLITIYFARSAWSKNKYAFQHHLIRSRAEKGKDSKAMQIFSRFRFYWMRRENIWLPADWCRLKRAFEVVQCDLTIGSWKWILSLVSAFGDIFSFVAWGFSDYETSEIHFQPCLLIEN